ncbi:MAG: hypothetical protein NVSMB57_16540 [Actinomycetota bacterium]
MVRVFRTLGIVLVISIAVGYALRGRLGRLADLRLCWTPVLFASLLAGLIPVFVTVPSGPARILIAVANIGILAFMIQNARFTRGLLRVGLVLCIAGWFLNGVVNAANGGMPLSLWAYARSGQHQSVTQGKGGFFKIVIADKNTVLKPLGDVIPIAPIHMVLSIGDLLLALGVGVVITGAMTSKHPDAQSFGSSEAAGSEASA